MLFKQNRFKNRKLRNNLILFIWLHILLTVPMLAQEMDGHELLLKAEGLKGRKEQSVVADISITVLNNLDTINAVRYTVYYKGHNKTLVKQTEPIQVKGNSILMLDNNMWFHARGNSRSIRITPQQRLIGGASNADIAKIGFSFDYQASIVAKDTFQNEVCYKLELKAKNNHLPYQLAYVWISKKKDQLKKAELYAVSGQKLKTIHYGNYRTFGGKINRPQSMIIFDHLFGKNKKTVIEYISLKPTNVPSKYFNINYLVHIK